jgi:hypothetical protein
MALLKPLWIEEMNFSLCYLLCVLSNNLSFTLLFTSVLHYVKNGMKYMRSLKLPTVIEVTNNYVYMYVCIYVCIYMYMYHP